MQLIKILYESIIKAMIRFWDNRFIKNTDIDYFKMALERQQDEYRELVKNITTQKTTNIQPESDETEWKPVQSFVPWHIKRQQLESASRQKAIDLAREAKINIEKSKSTEQLENELLNGTD